ncbi:MAG: helix-turn-helix transcriptional regulator [Chitinophagaceae bacterium]|nr:helix-turn-helix transcriptional regulator [Chitinophagaceae bacterium]
MGQEHKVYVKGMVCQRCIRVVSMQLDLTGIPYDTVSLGELVFSAQTPDLIFLDQILVPLGFRVLQQKNKTLIQDLKALIYKVFDGNFDFPTGFRFSTYAAQKLRKDYRSLSALFAQEEAISLEQYIIQYKTSQVKYFLRETDLTLLELSVRFGYSSVAHLSKQFKQLVGISPSIFKQQIKVTQR